MLIAAEPTSDGEVIADIGLRYRACVSYASCCRQEAFLFSAALLRRDDAGAD